MAAGWQRPAARATAAYPRGRAVARPALVAQAARRGPQSARKGTEARSPRHHLAVATCRTPWVQAHGPMAGAKRNARGWLPSDSHESFVHREREPPRSMRWCQRRCDRRRLGPGSGRPPRTAPFPSGGGRDLESDDPLRVGQERFAFIAERRFGLHCGPDACGHPGVALVGDAPTRCPSGQAAHSRSRSDSWRPPFGVTLGDRSPARSHGETSCRPGFEVFYILSSVASATDATAPRERRRAGREAVVEARLGDTVL